MVCLMQQGFSHLGCSLFLPLGSCPAVLRVAHSASLHVLPSMQPPWPRLPGAPPTCLPLGLHLCTCWRIARGWVPSCGLHLSLVSCGEHRDAGEPFGAFYCLCLTAVGQ